MVANWRIIVSLSAIVLSACAYLYPPSEPFVYSIDPAVQPSRPSLPGLDGGPPRPVGVVVGPDGQRDEFVANEVVLRPHSPAASQAFLDRYGGVVLRDGRPLLLPGKSAAAATSSGWYLVRVDPARSALDDLAANMQTGGSRGQHLFSSQPAARLAALLAREKQTGRQLVPNFLLQPSTVSEHPDGSGGFLNAEDWWWMSEDDDPNTPGEQGRSIGVIHIERSALDALRGFSGPHHHLAGNRQRRQRSDSPDRDYSWANLLTLHEGDWVQPVK